MPIRRLLVYLIAASPGLVYCQVPEDASLALLVQLVSVTGVLKADTRDIFLKNSNLSADQAHTVTQLVDRSLDLQILEGNTARMRKQPSADFPASERSRRQILRDLAINLQKELGPDGWARFGALLQSIEQKTTIRRGLCNSDAVVYTFGTTLQSPASVIAIAVADATYSDGERQLYAEASVRSPGGREVTARSPASPLRIHAAAIAALDIGFEDGNYAPSFQFGESCGQDKVLQLYRDRQN